MTASYPKKDLILQDFPDVEYIPLETTDEFITSAKIHAIGKDIMAFTNKNPMSLVYETPVFTLINNNEIAFAKRLEAPDLVEAYGKGQLKGRLKEIAAGLDEESNAVIMLAKYKK